jgi:hypothetical protein
MADDHIELLVSQKFAKAVSGLEHSPRVACPDFAKLMDSNASLLQFVLQSALETYGKGWPHGRAVFTFPSECHQQCLDTAVEVTAIDV